MLAARYLAGLPQIVIKALHKDTICNSVSVSLAWAVA